MNWNRRRILLFGFVSWLLYATPLMAGGRGFPDAETQGLTIPSAHVATTSQAAVEQNQSAPFDDEFPLLEKSSAADQDQASSGGFATPLVTVGSSLLLVLGLFAGLVWLTRKFGGSAVRAGSMPSDVLQPLGSTAIDARTRVMMLRCGSRIVVIAQTQGGMQPLCEITDPREVHELTMACTGQSQPTFAETLKAAQQQQADREPQEVRRGRLFATA